MSSPLNFNDPYDSALSIIFKDLIDDKIKLIKQYFWQQKDTQGKNKKQLSILKTNHSKNIFQKFNKYSVVEEKINFVNTQGVTCFSEINDNLLMWAHYSDRYQGICLEFLTEYEPFNKIKKIIYTSQLPIVDILTILSDDKNSSVDDLYCKKSKSWKYEKEWRLIQKVAGTSNIYPISALKAIYFGPNIEREIRDIICIITQSQSHEVEFWEGKLSGKNFKIEFTKFQYIPDLNLEEIPF
jgi:hypothetical protein